LGHNPTPDRDVMQKVADPKHAERILDRGGGWKAIFVRLRAKTEIADGRVRWRRPKARSTKTSPDLTVLVVSDGQQGERSYRAGIASQGHRVLTAVHPVDAIKKLRDGSESYDVVFAPASDCRFPALEFFGLLAAEFPLVRRIAYAKNDAEHAKVLNAGLLDVVLTYPTSDRLLAEALRPPKTTSTASMARQCNDQSDSQLFQSWNRSDDRAFAELDRRYRPRIRRLVKSMRFSDEDVEDIVQETLLNMFVERETLCGCNAPDRLVCNFAASCVLSRLRGEQRQARLRASLVSAAQRARAQNERSGQPDDE